MKRVSLEVCGSLTFDGPPTIRLTHFEQDSQNENRFIPKYACGHREGRCKMSTCGRRPIFKWYCLHFKKEISLLDCRSCNVRQQG